MDKIKELTDFYMWMQENDYDHNIRARVERKAEIYLNSINVRQKLNIQNVVEQSEQLVCECMPDPKCRVKNGKIICYGCNKERK